MCMSMPVYVCRDEKPSKGRSKGEHTQLGLVLCNLAKTKKFYRLDKANRHGVYAGSGLLVFPKVTAYMHQPSDILSSASHFSAGHIKVHEVDGVQFTSEEYALLHAVRGSNRGSRRSSWEREPQPSASEDSDEENNEEHPAERAYKLKQANLARGLMAGLLLPPEQVDQVRNDVEAENDRDRDRDRERDNDRDRDRDRDRERGREKDKKSKLEVPASKEKDRDKSRESSRKRRHKRHSSAALDDQMKAQLAYSIKQMQQDLIGKS